MRTKNYIYCETVGRYVTGTEGSNACWEAGKDAMAFSLTRAKDILEGLTLNCWEARIEIYPDFIKVKNKGDEKNE